MEKIERSWLEHEITIFCTWTPKPMQKLKLNGKGTWETSEQSWVSTGWAHWHLGLWLLVAAIPFGTCQIPSRDSHTLTLEKAGRIVYIHITDLNRASEHMLEQNLTTLWRTSIQSYLISSQRKKCEIVPRDWLCCEIIRKVDIGMTCEVN